MDDVKDIHFHRPPAGAVIVPLRTDRAGRLSRYHAGARLGDGPLLIPEACNLDQAKSLVEVSEAETIGAAPALRCRRCYKNRAA